MATTQRISRTTSPEEYLDRAVLRELLNNDATPAQLAERIGGIPVNREPGATTWMGSWPIDGRAVAPSLARLKKRQLVWRDKKGIWTLTRKGWWNGYWTAALLAEKGIKITGLGRHVSAIYRGLDRKGKTRYRVEQDGKTIGYIESKNENRRGSSARNFICYAMTKRGDIRLKPEPGVHRSTVQAAAKLAGLS